MKSVSTPAPKDGRGLDLILAYVQDLGDFIHQKAHGDRAYRR